MDVVSAQAMAAAEMRSFETYGDHLAEEFMERAGRALAGRIREYLQTAGLQGDIVLVCGSGNNGGDAFVCGRILRGWGWSVCAVQPAPGGKKGGLCELQADRFRKAGGDIFITDKGQLPFSARPALIVDGLLGTGFKGPLRDNCKKLIRAIAGSKLPVVAIDLPSGLDGDGHRPSDPETCVKSDLTLFLGRPKTGAFVYQNFDYIGVFETLDFGLQKEFTESLPVTARLYSLEDLSLLLPALERSRHKYQAGVVWGFAGSPGMGGAAQLASEAALRSGCGMMRLRCYREVLPELAGLCPEVIVEAAGAENGISLKEAAEDPERAAKFIAGSRDMPAVDCGAFFTGPGLGRSSLSEKICRSMVENAECPLVCDADALSYHAIKPFHLKHPGQVVFTPHTGEIRTLLGTEEPFKAGVAELNLCQQYVESSGVNLLLKGAVTRIFSPGKPPALLTWGDPGMATAGAGDVLTGIIAGFLAQGLTARDAAILGGGIHGLAGSLAAAELTSFCVTASDLIRFLPAAFRRLLSLRQSVNAARAL